MKKLEQIKDQYEKLELTADVALELIFEAYLISESTLEEHGLEIQDHGYGIYQLRQNREFLMEGEKTECQERANEIINKHIDNERK